MYLRCFSNLTTRVAMASRMPMAATRGLRTAAALREDAIQYTITDEAPQLATYAFLPVIRRICEPQGIKVHAPDISVAARIIAAWPDKLKPEQQKPDALSMLGELALTPDANIIKLPNISASVPQLNEAIAELRDKGYNVPFYPQNPTTEEEKAVAKRYSAVIGSAVNPVLREGNSDRRVAEPVKRHAQRSRPPVRMREWTPDNRTHVASMSHGDFFESEQSTCMEEAAAVSIIFEGADGSKKELKKGLTLQAGEVIDATFMSAAALREFLAKEMQNALDTDILLSLHLKCTMMKISDPIIFGHAVSVYFAEVFDKYRDTFAKLGVNPNNGVADLEKKVASLKDEALRSQIQADIKATYDKKCKLAMVDSRNGITNLHSPNDVIIDASMPPLIRDAGMWNWQDGLEPTKALVPDRSYSGLYQRIVEDCQKNGQFDHSTMGSVSNVGLMAQKAEEYGSHDKTFEVPGKGTMRVVDSKGKTIFEHKVDKGDIWRMCQVKDAPIRDWVRLAVSRARATGDKAIFWLDEKRAHDRTLIGLVNKYLKEHDTKGLDLAIMAPADAMVASLERVRAGKNTISVTGNVLRDYLTDLFPILELGTSAKMLSIVPLLGGGGLYETGAGGSAPKHVDQFLKEGHLRWDSLGEYLALQVSLEDMGERKNNDRAKMLARTLNTAIGRVLDEDRSPQRKVGQPDNRLTTYYIALFWATELAKEDASYKDLADKLKANEEQIAKDLVDCQGPPAETGGYYLPDDTLAAKAMRPSAVFNSIIDA